MSQATYKQRLTLWKVTQKDFYTNKLAHEIDLQEASDLIGKIFEYQKGFTQHKDYIEERVRYFTGDNTWTVEMLRRYYKRGKKQDHSPQPEPQQEPEPQPEPEMPQPEPEMPQPEPEPQQEPEPEPEMPQPEPEMPKAPEQLPDFSDMTLKQIQEWAEEIARKQSELEQERERLKRELQEQGPVEYHPEGDDYIKPAIFDEVASYIAQGLNVYLAGPAGCGKTLMLRKIAEVIERDAYIHSCSGGPERASLIESCELVSEGGTQITKTIVAAPLEHMTKDMSLTVLDELPALERECGMALNSLLEPSSRAVNTRAGMVKRSDSNVIAATGNTTGLSQDRKYMGSQLQDGSMKDRFITVRMEYDENVEYKIAAQLLKPADATRILKRLRNLREKVTAYQIPFDPSTRRLVNACRAKAAGASIDRAFEVAFLNDLENHDRSRVKERD